MTLLAVLVVGIAAYRLARAVSVDTISEPLRSWVFWRGHDDRVVTEGAVVPTPEPVVTSRPWAWAYGLVSCPFCSSWWLALAFYALWVHDGWDRRQVVAAIAAAGVAALCTSLDGAANRDG